MWLMIFSLAVTVLGTARLVVLVTSDRITRPLRYRVERRWGRESYPGTLVRCAWCAGWWIALPIAVAWWRWPGHTTEVLAPFALAMVVAILAGHFAPNDDPPLYTTPSDSNQPFRTVDHFGNKFLIQHGNVATDGPTPATIVPIANGDPVGVNDSSPSAT